MALKDWLTHVPEQEIIAQFNTLPYLKKDQVLASILQQTIKLNKDEVADYLLALKCDEVSKRCYAEELAAEDFDIAVTIPEPQEDAQLA